MTMSEEIIEVVCKPCPLCKKCPTVTMPAAAYENWNFFGMAIQKAWPQGSKGDRESLISGYHDDCFNQAFPPEEQ